MKCAEEIRRGLGQQLAALDTLLAAADDAVVTIVCVPRHGHATTRTTVESLFASTPVPFRLIVVDIASLESVRDFLEAGARTRRELMHVRLDEFVSRQTARLVVLDRIHTPYTVLVDNNMLFRSGWLEALLACAEETGAAMVSPVIVTQGGHIHFSGGFVVPYEGVIVRPHAQRGGPNLLRPDEVRAFVTGYDRPLPKDHMRQINEALRPTPPPQPAPADDAVDGVSPASRHRAPPCRARNKLPSDHPVYFP